MRSTCRCRCTTSSDFLAFAEAMGIEGASVTIPFKLDALQAAASSDALTQLVGAANTLRRTGAGWEATNTDVEAFCAARLGIRNASLDGVRASVLGAGGAARAVIVALALAGRAGHGAREARRAGAGAGVGLQRRRRARGRRQPGRGTCWSIARRSAAPARRDGVAAAGGPI